MTRSYKDYKLTMGELRQTAEECKNWGKWGPDDEVGTLNYITPEDIIGAARLIQKGKVFSLAVNFDQNGPQAGLWGRRYNPIHSMLATGTDAVAGRQDAGGIRYADDMVSLPLQCGTQWDGLGHIFYDEFMWNGYDARLVDAEGAHKNGIENVRDKMVGRGILLDIARLEGVAALAEGTAITNADLDRAAETQGVEVKRGDFVLVRTGMTGERMRNGEWGGYAGGDAPGLAFETARWLHEHESAAICCDTWGCEVRPNETTEAQQPWHWVVIPMMGISMGEIFDMEELAADCEEDGRWEFFFVAPPLPITRAVGSPLNPIAIK
jgi:kynurenine formamidase